MDEQSRTWSDRASAALAAAPLVPVACAMILGIWTESRLDWPAWAYPAAAAGALAAWLALRLVGRRSRPRLVLLIAIAWIGGAWRIGLTRHALPADHIALSLAERGELVQLRGSAQGRVELTQRDLADFPGVLHRDPGSAFVVEAEALKRGLGPWRPASGLVQVTCSGPALHVTAGAPLELTGVLYPVRPSDNPGATDRRRASHDRRIFAVLWLPNESAAVGRGPAPDGPHDARANWRHQLRARAHGLLLGEPEPLTGDDRSLIDGLVLGRRDAGLDAISQPFLRTGTYHFLAISGLHLGILAGGCWLLLRLLRVGPRRSAAVVLIVVTAYCLMAEPRPPILRAWIVLSLFCVAVLIGRAGSSVNFLAAAAVLLLLVDPGELFGAGWQLSFTIVLGLLLFAGPLYRRLAGPLAAAGRADPDSPPPWTDAHPLLAQAARAALGVFAVSVIAWIVGLPLIARYFHRIYPWSILASLLLWPLVCAILSLGFAKMLLSAAAPAVGAWLNGPLHSTSSALLTAVNWLDSLPGSQVTVASPPIWLIGLYYAFLLSWKVRPRWLRPSLLAASGSAALLASLVLAGGGRDEAVLTVLSVGDGSAQVLRTPAGRHAMFDCGTMARNNVGESDVVPFLAEDGRPAASPAVSAVFLSHPNLDHYSGLVALARRGLVGELIESPARLPDGRDRACRRLYEMLDEADVPRRRVAAGAAFEFDGVRGRLLWPPEWIDRADGLAVNDAAQVWKLRVAGRSILLTGDIMAFAQQRLLDGAAAGQIDLHADVLVMPHHGGVVDNTADFVEAVAPSVVVISTSRSADEIVPRCPPLAIPGRRVLLTAEAGAVTVRVARDGTLAVDAWYDR